MSEWPNCRRMNIISNVSRYYGRRETTYFVPSMYLVEQIHNICSTTKIKVQYGRPCESQNFDLRPIGRRKQGGDKFRTSDIKGPRFRERGLLSFLCILEARNETHGTKYAETTSRTATYSQ